MATLVKFKCTKCDHTTEQYSYVTGVYHEGCVHAKKGTIGVEMRPLAKESAA